MLYYRALFLYTVLLYYLLTVVYSEECMVKNRNQEGLREGVLYCILSDPENCSKCRLLHTVLYFLTKNFRVIGFQFLDGRPCTYTP